jgi:SagB-type dehydrogenase family enzyme
VATNRDLHVARAYRERTTHTPASVRASAHRLDWDHKPFPFKLYPELPPHPLPRELDPLAVDTLQALGAGPAEPAAGLTLEHLATLLYFAAGVTKKKTYADGTEVLFRAAPSTGALYQTEVYVAAGAVAGLEPGLYHFCPGDFALRALRRGDVRGALAEAAADPAVAERAATVILTAIYWRNTWKYRARGWRHLYWDSGTMLANLLAVGHALRLGPRLLTGFVDAEVNRLLGVDATREAALELVTLGPRGPAAPAAAPGPELRHAVMPLSAREVDEPLVREMQQASALTSAAEVVAWRGSLPPPSRQPEGALTALPAARTRCGRSLGETIQRRGSTRRFRHAPLQLEELATVLWWATRPVEADVPWGLTVPYVTVHAVEGLAAGAWCYWPEAHTMELVRSGTFRRESAFLCLEQALGGDAAAVLYFLAPVDALLERWGNRGYRLANLQAGVMGGRAYLAAYGQGFGATGLTFYDREVVRFFGAPAQGLDAVFVTALGRAARPLW